MEEESKVPFFFEAENRRHFYYYFSFARSICRELEKFQARTTTSSTPRHSSMSLIFINNNIYVCVCYSWKRNKLYIRQIVLLELESEMRRIDLVVGEQRV